ncbi:MAG: phosphate signaling complex protein PhoU [Chloroflexi bacterium]|uniref:Phosphate-specific transport system accessory protein PhoU n=1 Tax=Candidatus Chlorohelix allophototropha TaxID=3003348 RepID=A0A8T7M198_9CHLR|nr:phosphate signaling complex protein PhoU [Chloroflexota bacterium]WJW67628.1 phosphate signaling complex protein PhoU [Chloroflexota bacterium L227-S17]
MARETFQRNLRQLQDQILELGSMVEKALHQAITALKYDDVNLAAQVIKNDVALNMLRYKVEEDALGLIASQQPVAHDLRIIAAALFIAVELERMGDHAKGIARISQLMNTNDFTKVMVTIGTMAEKCGQMLHTALDCYVQEDYKTAAQLPNRDDEVDALFDEVFRELIATINADSSKGSNVTYLIWAAHNLERIADRTVNICERVIFTATGKLFEEEVHAHEELPILASALLELEN